MNIWIFNHYAITPDLPGGTRHYDLGRELVQRGHQITIFATSFHHYLRRETRLQPWERWKIEDVDGIKFIWLRTPSYFRNDWRRVWNMVCYALKVWWLACRITKLMPELGKPDVVIGSSPHLLTPLAAYWVSRYFRAFFVMEVRDLWPQTIIDMKELSARNPITKILQVLERFLYHRAERIITLMPRAHEYISTYGVSLEKIVWISNGVDLSRFDRVQRLGECHEVFQVMYLGAHGKANAIDVLIKVAKIIQDRDYREIRFILVGDGSEKSKLMALTKDLRLNNVEFRNPVPKSKVVQLLAEAHVLVVQLGGEEIYRWGISSNKLFDFMAAGRPVLSSADAPCNPVVGARCGFVIPSRDPAALAEAVIKLYKMPSHERETMGRRGREYVEEHYDIKKLANRLEHVLTEMAHLR